MDKTTTAVGAITGALTGINGLLNYFGYQSLDPNLAGLIMSAGIIVLGYFSNKRNMLNSALG